MEVTLGSVLCCYNFGTQTGGPGWGRQHLTLSLSRCLIAVEADTRFSVFLFDLVFEALVYTLFWCYLTYRAVCVARIIVSVFWVLD